MNRFSENVLVTALSVVLLALINPTAMPPPDGESGARWGPNGHRITAQIAENHLTDRTRAAIRQLIGQASLAQLATWADEIRSDTTWDYAAPWHYITIEDTFAKEPTAKARYRAATTRSRGNVVEAIKYFESLLRQRDVPDERRRTALKFLVHFVGDVHQPLHVGRGDDLGGNRVSVHWFGEQVNLHKVWDEGLIESQNLSFSEFARFIDQAPADQRRNWQNSTCLDWMNESFELRNDVYSLQDLSKHADRDGNLNLSYAYAFERLPIVKQRLVQGGVRLAGVLNSIFDGSGRTTCDLADVRDTVRLKAGH